MKSLSGYERFEILNRATALLRQRADEMARTLSMEEGKTLGEALFEVDRAAQTLELSGEEAKRLSGEVLPLDGGKGVKNKLGFTLRIPCGVVAAIAPFNFPLNLVCHKVGPAVAAASPAAGVSPPCLALQPGVTEVRPPPRQPAAAVSLGSI